MNTVRTKLDPLLDLEASDLRKMYEIVTICVGAHPGRALYGIYYGDKPEGYDLAPEGIRAFYDRLASSIEPSRWLAAAALKDAAGRVFH